MMARLHEPLAFDKRDHPEWPKPTEPSAAATTQSPCTPLRTPPSKPRLVFYPCAANRVVVRSAVTHGQKLGKLKALPKPTTIPPKPKNYAARTNKHLHSFGAFRIQSGALASSDSHVHADRFVDLRHLPWGVGWIEQNGVEGLAVSDKLFEKLNGVNPATTKIVCNRAVGGLAAERIAYGLSSDKPPLNKVLDRRD